MIDLKKILWRTATAHYPDSVSLKGCITISAEVFVAHELRHDSRAGAEACRLARQQIVQSVYGELLVKLEALEMRALSLAHHSPGGVREVEALIAEIRATIPQP